MAKIGGRFERVKYELIYMKCVPGSDETGLGEPGEDVILFLYESCLFACL